MPLIGAGLVDQQSGRVGLRSILQVVIEKWLHDRAAKPGCRVALKKDGTDTTTLFASLTVIPRAEHQMHQISFRILRRQGLKYGRTTVDVLLIKQAIYQQHGHFYGLCRQQLVDCLVLPELVVGWVCRQIAPETEL